MKHLGDICKINGAEIEPVDCITGGSPCQDLSIAGKRAGLAGERSGLFMEQVRIVKEMRDCDRRNGRAGDMVRPRFLVWENVPGAFSSNGGGDFQAVLEEIIHIAEPTVSVPRFEGKWTKAGAIDGDGWSVAWRTHDAQYWGVPQRRRRISVVADFGGQSAGEILFERKSVSRHFAESGTVRERLAGNAESGAGRTGESIAHAYGETGVGYWQNGVQTLRAEGENRPSRPSNVVVCMATQQGGAELRTDDRSPTLTAAAGMSGNNQPVVCAGFKLGNSEQAWSIGCAEEQSPTLNAECGGNKPAVLCLNDQGGNVMGVSHDVSSTLRAQEHGHQPSILDMSHACDAICECGEVVPALQARMGTGGNQVPLTYQMQGFGDYREGNVASGCKQRDFKDGTDLVCAVDCRNFCEGGETNGTLQAKSNGGVSYNLQNTVRTGMIVRRLTPMECERLQGFPDGWTDIGEWIDDDGRTHKQADAPRYKALGNSIALPFWYWILRRMAIYLPEGATLGSLFDGIGGFPLCWESIHGKGTARWASEIEKFPMAVTKLRFPEEA